MKQKDTCLMRPVIDLVEKCGRLDFSSWCSLIWVCLRCWVRKVEWHQLWWSYSSLWVKSVSNWGYELNAVIARKKSIMVVFQGGFDDACYWLFGILLMWLICVFFVYLLWKIELHAGRKNSTTMLNAFDIDINNASAKHCSWHCSECRWIIWCRVFLSSRVILFVSNNGFFIIKKLNIILPPTHRQETLLSASHFQQYSLPWSLFRTHWCGLCSYCCSFWAALQEDTQGTLHCLNFLLGSGSPWLFQVYIHH